MCHSEYIEVTVERKKFYGLDTNVSHLADKTCLPVYRDEDKVVFKFALDECKTQQVVDDDAISYKNRIVAIVKDVDEYLDITRVNTHLVPFQCTYKKTASISTGRIKPLSALMVITNTGNISVFDQSTNSPAIYKFPFRACSFILEDKSFRLRVCKTNSRTDILTRTKLSLIY